jgi:hypothetical protein
MWDEGGNMTLDLDQHRRSHSIGNRQPCAGWFDFAWTSASVVSIKLGQILPLACWGNMTMQDDENQVFEMDIELC